MSDLKSAGAFPDKDKAIGFEAQRRRPAICCDDLNDGLQRVIHASRDQRHGAEIYESKVAGAARQLDRIDARLKILDPENVCDSGAFKLLTIMQPAAVACDEEVGARAAGDRVPSVIAPGDAGLQRVVVGPGEQLIRASPAKKKVVIVETGQRIVAIAPFKRVARAVVERVFKASDLVAPGGADDVRKLDLPDGKLV